MPELPPFPDVADRVAREVQPPPFERVVDRARRRRRRHALAVTGVTATVVAVVAAATVLGTPGEDAAPQPTGPPSKHSDTKPGAVDAAAVVANGGLVAYAAAQDGALATVWKLCDPADETSCKIAWQVQANGEVHQGMAGNETATVQDTGQGFVLDSWGRHGVVVDTAGNVHPIRPVDAGTVGATDVVIRDGRGFAVLDPRTATSWKLTTAPDQDGWMQAALASDGSIWAMSLTGTDVRVTWSIAGTLRSSWHEHLLEKGSLPAYLVTSRDHVAALTGLDGATVLPVADLAITTDAGDTWTDLQQSQVPFKTVDSMAATSAGTLYVVTPGGQHLYRTTDESWTEFTEVPNPEHADALVSAGDHVVARAGTFERPTFVAFDDTGHSTPVPLAR